MTPGAWTTIRVRGTLDRPAVINALFRHGAQGVQELDDEVITHVLDADTDAIAAAIQEADAAAAAAFEPTPAVDWSAEWKSRIRAHRVGSLVVTPPWLADGYAERERIVIEPAMAFGTGEHETTRGVLRLLQQVVRGGDRVADLGAGSGVLGIAAARLGAGRVVCIESDPDAIGNAEENVRRNGVGDRVTILEGDAAMLLPLVAPVRVVLANIVSSVLLDLSRVIRQSLGEDGVAIFSGILLDERDRFVSALTGAGWRMRESDQEGAWWSTTIEPR